MASALVAVDSITVLDAFTLGLVGAAAAAVVAGVVRFLRWLVRLERRLDRLEENLGGSSSRGRGTDTRNGPPLSPE